MSALADHEIHHLVCCKAIEIEPYAPHKNLQGQSYDVHLMPILKNRRGTEFEIPPAGLEMHFGDFRLGSTVERIKLPPWIIAKVEGKSTNAREALSIEAAGHVDGGFRGRITLEISQTDNSMPSLLLPDMAIAQLVFYRTATPDRPYGHDELDSHYMDQDDPTLSWHEQRG